MRRPVLHIVIAAAMWGLTLMAPTVAAASLEVAGLRQTAPPTASAIEWGGGSAGAPQAATPISYRPNGQDQGPSGPGPTDPNGPS
jgi:hypothetical protein